MEKPKVFSRALTRRSLLKAAGAGIVVSLLTACQPKAPAPSGQATSQPAGQGPTAQPPAPKELTITFLSAQAALKEQDPLAVLMKQFTEKNPGTKIATLTTAAGDDYFTKLVTMTAAKTPPDIFYMPPWNLIEFTDKNLLASLDPYVAAGGFDIADVPKALVEAYTWDGALLGLPVLGIIARIWAYNKDAFDAAGVPYPKRYWTMDDFLEKVQRVVRKKGGEVEVWGVDPRLTDNAHLLPWLWTYGGDFYNYPKLDKCIMDSPESVRAMQASVDLIRKYKVQAPPEIGPNDLGISFQTGKIAISAVGSGSWVDPAKAGEFLWAFKWGLIDQPKVTEARALIHSTGLSLSASSANRDAAWKLLAFLMSEESQKFYSERTGKIAAIKSVGAKVAFKNIPADDQKLIEDVLEYAWGRARWRTRVWSKSAANAQQIWSAMWLGKMSVEEACKQATKDTNQMLEEAAKALKS